jgi:F-type H+-transporting ATPase subunit epsilon
VALHCVITSPEGLVFEGDARFVVVPAVDGEMGILPRHAPLIAALGAGEIRVETAESSEKKRFFLDGGFVQVLNNDVAVLATEAEALESLNRTAAEERLKQVLGSPPPRNATLEERDGWQDKIRVARRRVKLAS